MTQPTGDGAQSGTPGTQSGAGTTDGTSADGTTATTPAEGAQSGTETQTDQQISREEYEALKRRLVAADQNTAKYQAELKKLNDAQLSEQERTKRDLEEARGVQAKLQEELKMARIQNAFITDNTYTWHNPKAALRLADLEKVTIDDSGTASGLKEALKEVAEAHPYLLKPAEGSEEGNKGGKPGGPTGVAGTGSSNASGADQTTLRKKFPQLAGRVTKA